MINEFSAARIAAVSFLITMILSVMSIMFAEFRLHSTGYVVEEPVASESRRSVMSLSRESDRFAFAAELAKSLEAAGAVMYGLRYCKHCTEQVRVYMSSKKG